ncbi:MAG TPA: stage II sporulation protein M [Streptosporangiaceae bacterium]
MDVDAFAAAHKGDWARLDALVRRRRRLSGDEVDELVALYQRTGTHLSALRGSGADPALVARLSASLARARAAVTGAQGRSWSAAGRFAAVSFPAMAWRLRWWWLGTAAASLLAAFLLGWWIARSPSAQSGLLSSSQVNSLVNHQFRSYYSQFAAQSFAAKVWTNNAFVAAEALISGIFLGIPTLLVLADNAANLGVVGGLMIGHGRTAEFFGLILPHGVLELSAVFLAAAAGLRLGWSIIDPGQLPRSRALAEQGRATVTVALGLVAVLLVSGAIEAFVTPSPLPTWARITIGLCAEAAFLSYVIVLGRRAAAAGLSADMAEAPDVLPVSA